MDDPVARHGEQRRPPVDEAREHVDEDDHHPHHEQDPRVDRVEGREPDGGDEADDRHEGRQRERDRVGPQVEDELLALDEESLRERHGAIVAQAGAAAPRPHRVSQVDDLPEGHTGLAVLGGQPEPPEVIDPDGAAAHGGALVRRRLHEPADRGGGREPRAPRALLPRQLVGGVDLLEPHEEPREESRIDTPSPIPAPPSRSAGATRFTPSPSTTNAVLPSTTSASARMPPTLASPSSRSFGHLQATGSPASDRIAPAIEAPARSVRSPVRFAARAGRSTTEKSNERPSSSLQDRPRRPRPSVWCAAATSVHSGAPSFAMRLRRRVGGTGNLVRAHGSRDVDPGRAPTAGRRG